MRVNVTRLFESFIIIGLLIPSGMLLGAELPRRSAMTPGIVNSYDSAQATYLFDQMQTLSFKVRREVARLQVQEQQLGWQYQAYRLAATKHYVNRMGNDLARLDQIKSGIGRWQKSLVTKITPDIHEIAYQLDAAINGLDAHENRVVLLLTQYPKNVNVIYANANQLAGTIGTVKHYVRAEQRLAALGHTTGNSRS